MKLLLSAAAMLLVFVTASATPAADDQLLLGPVTQPQHLLSHESVWTPDFSFSTAKTYTTIPLFGDLSPMNFYNFYGEVSIGTPPQTFKLLFDTEEDVLWIPNFQAPASQQAFYDHNKSSSYEADGAEYSSFGMLYEFEGFLSRDTIHFGDFTLSNVSFAEVTTVMTPSHFADLKIDGMFGLGTSPATNFVLQRLLRSGAIGESVFAFYLTKSKKTRSKAAAAVDGAPTSAGELTIGAIDKRRYTGDIHYVNTVTESMWSWVVILDGITVDTNKTSDKSVVKAELSNRVTAVVSPSYPFIAGPPEEIERLAEAVGADGDMIDCSSQSPDIVFHIGGVKYTLTKDEYTLRDEDEGNGDESCRWAFEAINSVNFWWIGQPFLQKYYTVFDFGDGVSNTNREPRVGFALAT